MDIGKTQGVTVGIGHERDESYVVLHVVNSVTVAMNETTARFLADQLLMTANTIWPIEDESETDTIEG